QESDVADNVIGVGDRSPVAPDQLLLAVSQDLAQPLVPLQETALGRAHRHADQRQVEKAAKTQLVDAGQLLRALPLQHFSTQGIVGPPPLDVLSGQLGVQTSILQ